MTIKHTPYLFRPEHAEKTVRKLREDAEDNWTYEIDLGKPGSDYALIKVYDEDMHFVGYL